MKLASRFRKNQPATTKETKLTRHCGQFSSFLIWLVNLAAYGVGFLNFRLMVCVVNPSVSRAISLKCASVANPKSQPDIISKSPALSSTDNRRNEQAVCRTGSRRCHSTDFFLDGLRLKSIQWESGWHNTAGQPPHKLVPLSLC